MKKTRATLCAAALLTAPVLAPAAPIRFGIEARAGYVDFTRAKDSTKALFDSSGAPTFGLGVRADVARQFFARLGASHLEKDGERVFVLDPASPVFKLGHPIEMTLTPIYLDLGFKFRPRGTLSPYLGLGAGLVRYKETSEVAGEKSEASATHFSARVIGGATWRVGRRVLVGLEAAYTTTPNALEGTPASSVAAVYGETDLGGLSGVATVTFRP
jgi:opacity protein-like surface antigen